MDAGAAEAGSDDASPAAPSTGERTGTKMTSASVKRACGSIAPSPLVDEAAKGETGARDILLSLAAAIEQRKFACAAALMDGAEGALDEEELNRLLDGPGKIWVAVPGGRMEGAAGSLYYEDDFRISLEKDGNREVLRTGKIVLRRVNDVPGATPEQLRWHVSRISFD